VLVTKHVLYASVLSKAGVEKQIWNERNDVLSLVLRCDLICSSEYIQLQKESGHRVDALKA